MSWLNLNSILHYFREPLDQIKDSVCDQNLKSPICGGLSYLSEKMGGTHTQWVHSHLDEFVNAARDEARYGTRESESRPAFHSIHFLSLFNR